METYLVENSRKQNLVVLTPTLKHGREKRASYKAYLTPFYLRLQILDKIPLGSFHTVKCSKLGWIIIKM